MLIQRALFIVFGLFFFVGSLHVAALRTEDVSQPLLVKKEERKSLVVTEYGEVTGVDIKSGNTGPYHLQFITLEPNSLFLPALLHADMVFYVHTGSGKLSWADEGKDMKQMNLRRGDVFRLSSGSLFFLQSDLKPERRKLKICTMFSNADEEINEPSIGAYSKISDLVLGFDKKLLQSAFKVPEDVIEEITGATKPPAIVHAVPTKKSTFWELESRLLKVLVGGHDGSFYDINGKSKRSKAFNILDADPDFENCNGWSVNVDKHHLKSLRGSNIGVFMVNLTKGSMMGPHWNPMAMEVAVVLQGQGMIRIVSSGGDTEFKNISFRVKEGDVFMVPRFHPMAQISFNNDSFVFMGFSTTTKRNHPQFLAGKMSVLQTLDREVLAVSFNVSNSTIDTLLASQGDSIILDCISCAEDEERIMEEEIKKEKEEEERRKREKERERKEKEEKKQKEEEEAARKREEEERRKREEEEERERRQKEEEERQKEEQRKREEAAKMEQEDARRQEEERRSQQREEQEKAEKEKEERKRREKEKEEKAKEEREKKERQRRKKEEEKAKEKEQEERKRHEKEEEEKSKKEKQKEEDEGSEEEPEHKAETRKEREREGGSSVGRRALRNA